MTPEIAIIILVVAITVGSVWYVQRREIGNYSKRKDDDTDRK